MIPRPPIRVLIVDDSPFIRRILQHLLTEDAGLEVVGTACNGSEGVQKAVALKPDVVTLDIEMPEMDGLTALKLIKRQTDAAVIMISTLTSEGSRATLRALHDGASDFLTKDSSSSSMTLSRLQSELRQKIHAVAPRRRRAIASPSATSTAATTVNTGTAIGRMALAAADDDDAPPASENCAVPVFSPDQFDLILIGSSTGGPPVLEKLLTGLPATMCAPIIVAQHMPALFTRVMSERLDSLSKLHIVHGEDGMPLEKGMVYVGQGGQHVRAVRRGLSRLQLSISPEPAEALYKPSVDELFSSGAEATAGRTLALILTGMGSDGSIGARRLAERNAKILAQERRSCAVWGMPKAVSQAGLASAELPPDGLLQALQQLGR